MEMKWYTVFTKPNWEKKVSATLQRKKIIHFCPVNIVSKQKPGIRNHDSFRGYVFVKIFESQITQLIKTGGVKNFMYWMNKPAVISESEVDLIKRFLNEHSHVKIEKRAVGFNAGILYNHISHKENEAKLIHLNNNKTKAALPSLGYMMIAEFEKSTVHLSLNKNVINHPKTKLRYRIAK